MSATALSGQHYHAAMCLVRGPAMYTYFVGTVCVHDQEDTSKGAM